MKIEIISTGETKVYHDYFKPLICKSDIDLPKMYNQGYNSYRFIGGEPEFHTKGLEIHSSRETDNYIFGETRIEVINSDGHKTAGYLYTTTNKATGEVKHTFSFE